MQIIGTNFRERERIKRLIQRWIKKFCARSPYEQSMLYAALGQALGPLARLPIPEHPADVTVQGWLASYPRQRDVDYATCVTIRDEMPEQRQARIFKGLLYDLQMAIDEFGYEAVYFGVGCEAFPDAVDPWAGNEQ